MYFISVILFFFFFFTRDPSLASPFHLLIPLIARNTIIRSPEAVDLVLLTNTRHTKITSLIKTWFLLSVTKKIKKFFWQPHFPWYWVVSIIYIISSSVAKLSFQVSFINKSPTTNYVILKIWWFLEVSSPNFCYSNKVLSVFSFEPYMYKSKSILLIVNVCIK